MLKSTLFSSWLWSCALNIFLSRLKLPDIILGSVIEVLSKLSVLIFYLVFAQRYICSLRLVIFIGFSCWWVVPFDSLQTSFWNRHGKRWKDVWWVRLCYTAERCYQLVAAICFCRDVMLYFVSMSTNQRCGFLAALGQWWFSRRTSLCYYSYNSTFCFKTVYVLMAHPVKRLWFHCNASHLKRFLLSYPLLSPSGVHADFFLFDGVSVVRFVC